MLCQRGGMNMERVEIRLPSQLLFAAQTLAGARDVSLGQLVRDALDQEVRRSAKPKTRTCADEALVARLQRLLAADIASATSWAHLERLLRSRGYKVEPAGGGLNLHDAQGRRLCKTSELGFGYGRLVKRFGAPMPGHPHRMAHLLAGARDVADSDDFDVFEPF
ncbi:hypothetical protein [uncultured Tateyamaria sp.]|uniref:hypothetical protein n=1 Tax=Tateyamaria sp. 1078 TaxID=3417464 RepID=UPI002608EBBD|nr:hypothetical protein [uncultured Tateyamaria sp.]